MNKQQYEVDVRLTYVFDTHVTIEATSEEEAIEFAMAWGRERSCLENNLDWNDPTPDLVEVQDVY